MSAASFRASDASMLELQDEIINSFLQSSNHVVKYPTLQYVSPYFTMSDNISARTLHFIQLLFQRVRKSTVAERHVGTRSVTLF